MLPERHSPAAGVQHAGLALCLPQFREGLQSQGACEQRSPPVYTIAQATARNRDGADLTCPFSSQDVFAAWDAQLASEGNRLWLRVNEQLSVDTKMDHRSVPVGSHQRHLYIVQPRLVGGDRFLNGAA